MKKVFLSLAALAFVATGVVSCSSDDGGSPAPTPEPEEQEDNTVRFNEEDSPLNGSYYELVTKNYELTSGETMEAPVIYNYPGGGYANAYYVNLGHVEGEEQSVYFYAMYLVQNTTIVIEDGSIADFGALVLPHETENVDFRMAYATVNGTVVQSAEGNLGTGELMINTLSLQGLDQITSYADIDLEGETDLETSFVHDSNDLNFKYNGVTALYTYNESEQQTGASSVNSSRVKKQLVSGLKSLDLKVLK